MANTAQKDVKYFHGEETHNLKAPRRIVPFIVDVLHPSSVVDIGCGVGTFLSVFDELGVKDLIGVDGSWVDRSKLFIPESVFCETDLEAPIDLGRRFDVAICLEVAEHLSASVADRFVADLCKASDLIVFSAAFPGQGGQNHINEQPPAYWQEKFAANGYGFFDVFRDRFWEDPLVDWWYKQNMFLAAKNGLKLPEAIAAAQLHGPARLHIHPDLYLGAVARADHFQTIVDDLKSVGGAARMAGRIVKGKFSKR